MKAKLHRHGRRAKDHRSLLRSEALATDEVERFALEWRQRLESVAERTSELSGERGILARRLIAWDLVGELAVLCIARQRSLVPPPTHLVDREATGDGFGPREHVRTMQKSVARQVHLEERELDDVLGKGAVPSEAQGEP